MDYSKKDGGTRVHDAMMARTLATGIGSSLNAIREHGSHRAAKVIAGIKPGQIVHDRGLEPHVAHRDAAAQACAADRMEDPPMVGNGVTDWPMRSGSKTHAQVGEMSAEQSAFKEDDQGEQKRVPTTGRHKRMHEVMQMPLRNSGK